MFKSIKAAFISAMIAIGAFSSMPAAANAGHVVPAGGGIHFSGDGFGFYFGSGGYRDRGYHRDRSYRHRHYRHRDRWERPRFNRFCTPRRALRKARRMGLHRARIARVGHNRIVVKGRMHGYRERIVFARAPRCPVIRW